MLGGRDADQATLSAFKYVIDKHSLTDLCFEGSHFTWCNKRRGSNCIRERLDRAFGNSFWLQLFPHCLVKLLTPDTSDHAPMLIYLNNLMGCKKSHVPLFRFEYF